MPIKYQTHRSGSGDTGGPLSVKGEQSVNKKAYHVLLLILSSVSEIGTLVCLSDPWILKKACVKVNSLSQDYHFLSENILY